MTFEYQEKWQYLTSICLNVTDACNLKCKYCFVTQQPHFMDLQVAKDVADWLMNNLKIKKEKFLCGENEQVFINFFGGEPMLMYDKIIVPLTEYLESTYDKKDFFLGMTTNGTLLSEEKINWFKEHNISLLLSIDGAEYTQNYNRPCQDETKKSFNLVMDNIPYILKCYPNIVFRSTIDQNTADHTFENYLFAESLGFKNIFMIPNCREQWKQENIEKLKIEINKIFNYIQYKFENNQDIMMSSNFEKAFRQVKQQIAFLNNYQNDNIIIDREQNHNVNRCGLGTTSGSIGYDGNIYGCQEQDSNMSDTNIFYLGNIYKNGIEIERHSFLLKKYFYQGIAKCENRELCYSCLLKNQCYELSCPSSTLDRFNDFAIIEEIYCIWNNLLFFNALKLTFYLSSQNNKKFINYFNNL